LRGKVSTRKSLRKENLPCRGVREVQQLPRGGSSSRRGGNGVETVKSLGGEGAFQWGFEKRGCPSISKKGVTRERKNSGLDFLVIAPKYLRRGEELTSTREKLDLREMARITAAGTKRKGHQPGKIFGGRENPLGKKGGGQ